MMVVELKTRRLCWGSSSIKICLLDDDNARTRGTNDACCLRLDVLNKWSVADVGNFA